MSSVVSVVNVAAKEQTLFLRGDYFITSLLYIHTEAVVLVILAHESLLLLRKNSWT